MVTVVELIDPKCHGRSFSFPSFFFKKGFFIYLRVRGWEGRRERERRKNPKQTPRWARSPTWDLISRLWDSTWAEIKTRVRPLTDWGTPEAFLKLHLMLLHLPGVRHSPFKCLSEDLVFFTLSQVCITGELKSPVTLVFCLILLTRWN